MGFGTGISNDTRRIELVVGPKQEKFKNSEAQERLGILIFKGVYCC